MEHDVYAKMFEFEKGFWWFVGRRKIVFNELAKITSTLANVVLVDIGCGTGITMELATGFQIMRFTLLIYQCIVDVSKI